MNHGLPKIRKRALGLSELIMNKYDVNIVIKIDLSQKLDVRKFSVAIRHLIQLHTFIIATIDTSDSDNFCFVSTKKLPPVKYIQHSEVPSVIKQELNYKFKDKEALCRIHVALTSKKSYILFTFHHAIADASSAFQCAADLVTLYTTELPINEHNDLSFPKPIENLLPNDLIPTSLPRLEKIESNKGKHKHHQSTTIILPSLFSSKNLQQYKTTSFAAIMSAFALKSYAAVIQETSLTRYLNIDLRTVLRIKNYTLAFYSVGIPETYCDIDKTSIINLIKKLELNMYKSITSSDFLAKGLAHNFPHPHTAGISYVRNPALLKLEQISIVTNAQIFGNCFYEETIEHKIFLLLTKFRNKLNISLHYDKRNFSNIAANEFMKVFLHTLQTRRD